MSGRRSRVFAVLVSALLTLGYATAAYAAPVVADSFVGSNLGTGITLNANYPALAQTFTAIDGTLDSATLTLQRIGSFPSPLLAEVYEVSGTFGSDAWPIGSPLAVSAPVDPASVGPDPTPVTFTFDNSLSLEGGKHYALVLRSPGAPASSGLGWAVEWNTPYPGNHAVFSASGNSWNANNLGSPDFLFAVYEEAAATPTVSSGATSNVSIALAAMVGVALLVRRRARLT